jgi:Transcription elongation factor, GreA/GreB, C-term
MTMTARALGGGSRRRWSMTTEAMGALRVDSDRLAAEAARPNGFVTAYMSGEPDAPSLIPNIDAQRSVRQLTSVRAALANASVETNSVLAVIGRRVTLESADGARRDYTLVIPGEGNPSEGCVSVDSPVGRAIYRRHAGDDVRVDAPGGVWYATVVSVE